MNPNELKQMYGTTPESFTRRVSFALHKTEDKPVKHIRRTILITAAIVVILTAAAYAAFSSQVLEFFGQLYGDDTKQWLEQGEVAVPDQSLLLDGVVFTVDEVIYRDNGLYGVGTIRPKEGSNTVIIGVDHMPDEPYGYDIYGEGGRSETAPADAKTIAEVAQENGANIMQVCALLEKIGVNGGEMLYPGCSGYVMMPQRDGSIRFSFEVSDATVVAKGTTYEIELWSCVWELTQDGQRVDNSRREEYWTVQIQPEPISEHTEEPAVETAVPTQMIGDVMLIVPDEYTENGTMPVYHAIPRDFGADLNPELFNQSGVATTEKGWITFNDEAQLDWSTETLFYNEYKGTYDGSYKDPEREPDITPLKTLSHAASDLAGQAHSAWPEPWEGIALTKTGLAGITLDEAKAKLEALLETLGVEGYTCDYALDMDTARIRSMGEKMNRMIEEHTYWNSPIMDYSQVSQENEGFYLHYGNGIKTDGNRFDVHAYVTEKGIVDLQIRDLYIQGDVVFTPDALVSPETVMAQLAMEIADSQYSDMELDHIISIELVYSPARASDKADGMVLTPAWYVVYQDNDGAKHGFDMYAIFDAVDGKTLYVPF